MKGLNTLFFFLLFGLSAYSQSYHFTWQAIIRDDSGTVWSNKELRLKWSILNEQMALRYAEEHKVFTNSQGLITLKIGNGENKEGFLDRIDWSKEKLIISFEVDLTAGRQFKNAMNHPLSVMPYAINAFSADSIKGSTSLSSIAGNGSFLYYDGQKWAGFPVGTAGQFLGISLSGDLEWQNPGTIPKLGDLSVRYMGKDSLFIKGSVEQGSATGLLSRGLVWDTLPEPTIKANNIRLEANPGISIDAVLNNWISGKKYYIRAFATNAYGTGYSAYRTFEPGGEKCKDGDKLTLSSFHGDTIDIGMPLSFWVEEYDNLHSLKYDLNGTKYASSTYREDLENPGTDFWLRTEAFHKSGCKMLSDTLRFKVLDLSKEVNVISSLIFSTNSSEKIFSYSSVDEIDVTGKNSWQIKVDDSMGSDIVFLGRRKEGLEDENLGLTYAVPGRDTLYFSAENTAYALLYLHAASRKKTTLPAMETFMKSKSDFTTLVKMLDDELIKKGRLDLFSEEKNSLIAKLLDEWSLFPGAVENKETDERPSPLFLLPNPYTYGTPLEYVSGDKPYIYAVVAANPNKTQEVYSDFLFRNTGSLVNVDFYGLLLSVFMSPEYYIHNTWEKRIPSISSEVMGLPPLKEGVMDSFMIITQSGRNFKESHNIKGNTTALAANLLEYLIGAFELTPVGAIFKFIKQYVGECTFALYKSIWSIISDFIDSINQRSVWVEKVPSLDETVEKLKIVFSSLYNAINSFANNFSNTRKGCKTHVKDKYVPYPTFKKNLELWSGILTAFDWISLGYKVAEYLTQPVSVEQIFYYMNGGIIQGRTVLSHNLNKNFFGMPGEFLTPDPMINFKQYEYVAKEAVVNTVKLGQGDYVSSLVIKEKVGNLLPSGLNDNLSLRFKLGEATESIKFQNGKLIDNTGISKDHLVLNLEAENELKWKVGTQVKPGKDIYMGSMVEGYFLNKDNIDPLPNVLKAEIGTLHLIKQPYTKGGNFKVRVTTQDKIKGIEGVKVEFEVVEGEANLNAIASLETGQSVSVLSDPTGECGVLVTGVKYEKSLKITAKILSTKGEILAMVHFPDPPEIITDKIDNITSVSARGGGFISKEGEGEIIERGLLWSKNPNPTIGGVDSKRTKAGTGVGVFNLNLENLESNTKYYVIAYAINEGGAVGFGDEIMFSTIKDTFSCVGTPTLTDIDNNTYKTVQIGTQCWMQSNLKVSKYQNGDAIPTGLSDNVWRRTTSGAYAIYDNNNANDALYGKLYNWYAVKDVRGLCPIGWHVPSEDEWGELKGHLEHSVAGGKLKSVTGWNSPNTGATNESGFTGLPGGTRYFSGEFNFLGSVGVWWSSSGDYDYLARYLYLSSNNGIVYRYLGNKENGKSVRCLRD